MSMSFDSAQVQFGLDINIFTFPVTKQPNPSQDVRPLICVLHRGFVCRVCDVVSPCDVAVWSLLCYSLVVEPVSGHRGGNG